MEKLKGNALYHLLALFVVTVWGVTYISTKVLLIRGLSPAEIMFIRFLTAYVLVWFVSPKKLWADNLKDEALLLLAGVCGGSLYFQTENMALEITLASNVAMILCTVPILTAVLSRLFVKGERLRRGLILGSLVALAGVALVICNGHFVLRLSPAGDLLTVLAALSWACYSLVLKRMIGRYPTVFITRKVFFYGLVTLLPVFAASPFDISPALLLEPVVAGNLLFLGVIASLGCYLIWNSVVKRLGPVRANNYIYLSPVVTLSASAIVLGEHITVMAIVGALMIIVGVYFAERGLTLKRN